jgi:hypothetical protein
VESFQSVGQSGTDPSHLGFGEWAPFGQNLIERWPGDELEEQARSVLALCQVYEMGQALAGDLLRHLRFPKQRILGSRYSPVTSSLLEGQA